MVSRYSANDATSRLQLLTLSQTLSGADKKVCVFVHLVCMFASFVCVSVCLSAMFYVAYLFFLLIVCEYVVLVSLLTQAHLILQGSKI